MSSGLLRKYAPNDVAIIVGTQAVTGLKEGTFVEADRAKDISSLDVGSDGEVTLIISPDQSGTIKITLQQSSPLNDFFATLHAALQQRNLSVAVVPVNIKDTNGTTVISANQAVVQKVTKVTFADKAEGREWTFLSGYLTITPGGESSI